MAKENVIEAVGIYNGHSAKGNFDIELKMLFTEIHLNEAIQFVVGIGQHLRMVAIVNNEKIKLGTWTVYRMAIDRNAQTTVVFKTNLDSAFVDNIPKLMVEDAEVVIKAQIVSE